MDEPLQRPLRREIVACIAGALEALGALDGAAVDEQTGLFGQGVGLDSIEALRIVTTLEARFDLVIEDDELDPEHFRTVGALAGFIEARIA